MAARAHTMLIYCLCLFTRAMSDHPGQTFCNLKPELTHHKCPSAEKYSDFIGRYLFPTRPIETLPCQSQEAVELMENGVPVVLKNCHFGEITKTWTPEYLEENLVSQNLTVYVSSSRRFLFYNSDVAGNYTWTPPHKRHAMNFSQFIEVKKELYEAGNGSRAYLQTDLVKEQLNSDMQDDIFMFDTTWFQNLKKRLEWGRLDVNLFLVGMPAVVTPAHYDIMENLFLQIHGKKRCILFSPESYQYLYPFPFHHPHDRQTQVNFDSPDFQKFPKFQNISGVDAVLVPGDVLYIPNYWWHYIESEKNSETISMNFWYDPKNDPGDFLEESGEDDETNGDKVEEQETRNESQKEKRESLDTGIGGNEQRGSENENKFVPLTAGELIGLSRQIEDMIGSAIGDSTKVGGFLKTMSDGRYDFV